uniref:Uncharacterized protein n=1 Tax=Glossina morsitans morsitans TaxID=37546 RepID=A0A1B0FL11_GLOMM
MKLTALCTLSKAVVVGAADYGNETSPQLSKNPMQNEVDSDTGPQMKIMLGGTVPIAADAVDALSAARQSMDSLKDALESENFFKAGDKVVANTVVTLNGLKSGLDDLTISLEKQLKKKNKNFNPKKKPKKATPVPTNDFQDDNLLRGLEAAKAASSEKLLKQARAVVGEKFIQRLDDARVATGDKLTKQLQNARDQALDAQLNFADVKKMRNNLTPPLRFGVDGPDALHLF